MDYTALIRKLLKETDWASEYYECTDEGFEITSDLFSLDVFINPETSSWYFTYSNDERGYSDEYVEGKGWNSLVDALFEIEVPGLETLDPSTFYESIKQWAIWCESEEDGLSGYVGNYDNYKDVEDLLQDGTVFSSEDEAQDFINNDPVMQAHIEIGDAEYRPVDITDKISALQESIEDETDNSQESTSIKSIDFWGEDEGEWNGDSADPEVEGSIDIRVSFVNNKTGSTWSSVYTIPARGTPINFNYYPARMYTSSGDPGDPEELDWDEIRWNELDIENADWKEDLTPVPADEYTDEEFDELMSRLSDIAYANEENIKKRKSIKF